MEDYTIVDDYHNIFIKTEVEDDGDTSDLDTKPVVFEALESNMGETEDHGLDVKFEAEMKKEYQTADTIFENKYKIDEETYDESSCNVDIKSVHFGEFNETNMTKEKLTAAFRTNQQIYFDVRPFKCTKCSFATKTEAGLRKHQIIHQEVTILKCDKCSYQTKRTDYLKTHQLIHTSSATLSITTSKRKTPVRKQDLQAEQKPFKCDQCPFRAKRECNLRCHQLVHKGIMEVQSFSCPTCDYVTKYKSDLARHKLIHLDPGEVETFKCDACDFIAKHPTNLKKHQLIHKRNSEVKKYSCTKCNFVTIHSSSLYKHQLVHLAPTLQCDHCSYKTIRWANLRQHQLVHKDISEVETFKCTLCDYITKRKTSLKSHMTKHERKRRVV